MKKILFVFFATMLMLTITNNFVKKVHAESLEKNTASFNQVNQDKMNIQGGISWINDQMNQVNHEILTNKNKIAQIGLELTAANAEVDKLNNELKSINDKIEKRNQILKERALAFQHNVGNDSYINTILNASSLNDFVDRIGAVMTFIEADRNILQQQQEEKKEYESKKAFFEAKQLELSGLQASMEAMIFRLNNQQNQYESLKGQLDKKNQELVNIAATEKHNEYINNIINTAKKYIGKSVYVFGGGRNSYDIANGRFDCSAFVHWAFAQAGTEIGSTTDNIKHSGQQVAVEEMQPGDLVFFDTYKKDGHVGIYLGDGKFIGSQCSTGVAIVDMTKGYWKNAFKGKVVRV